MNDKICLNSHTIKENEIWYAVKHINKNIRMNSRSGGVFTAISDYVLESGGRIYGCKTTEDFLAIHTYADTKEERDDFRGSKYIQSDMGDTFENVLKDLKENRKVLFSGTPCQVAALKKYVTITCADYQKNLILLDIVCHGVPSPKVWKSYLRWIEEKKHKEISIVEFRNKRNFGWADHVESIYFKDGSVFHGTYFRYLFYRHSILRPACYKCPYKGEYYSDITIADCWGIERVNNEFNDNQGVSLVIVNSEVGKTIFEKIKNDLEIIKCNSKDMLQEPLCKPCKEPENRQMFWDDFNNLKFEKIIKKYARDSFGVRTKRMVKRFLHKGGIYDKLRVNR